MNTTSVRRERMREIQVTYLVRFDLGGDQGPGGQGMVEWPMGTVKVMVGGEWCLFLVYLSLI